MALSQLKICISKQRAQGLTLIEVLIALAIISIALTSITKTVSQNIRSTAYLQNKTIAMWVAKDVINEVRAGVLQLSHDDNLKSSTNMLGKDWYWQVNEEETPNNHIKKISVKILEAEESEDVVLRMESYLYYGE